MMVRFCLAGLVVVLISAVSGFFFVCRADTGKTGPPMEWEATAGYFSENRLYTEKDRHEVSFDGGYESIGMYPLRKAFSETILFQAGVHGGHDWCRGYDRQDRYDDTYRFISESLCIGPSVKFRTAYTDSVLSATVGNTRDAGHNDLRTIDKEQNTLFYQVQGQFSMVHDRWFFPKIRLSGMIKRQIRDGDVTSHIPGKREQPEALRFSNMSCYVMPVSWFSKDLRSGLFIACSVDRTTATMKTVCTGIGMFSSAFEFGWVFSLDPGKFKSFERFEIQADGFQIFKLLKRSIKS